MSDKKELKNEELEQVSGGEFVFDKFYASITGVKNGELKLKHIGPYDSEEEALAAAKEIAISYYNEGCENIIYCAEECVFGSLIPGEEHYYPEV